MLHPKSLSIKLSGGCRTFREEEARFHRSPRGQRHNMHRDFSDHSCIFSTIFAHSLLKLVSGRWRSSTCCVENRSAQLCQLIQVDFSQHLLRLQLFSLRALLHFLLSCMSGYCEVSCVISLRWSFLRWKDDRTQHTEQCNQVSSCLDAFTLHYIYHYTQSKREKDYFYAKDTKSKSINKRICYLTTSRKQISLFPKMSVQPVFGRYRKNASIVSLLICRK